MALVDALHVELAGPLPNDRGDGRGFGSVQVEGAVADVDHPETDQGDGLR